MQTIIWDSPFPLWTAKKQIKNLCEKDTLQHYKHSPFPLWTVKKDASKIPKSRHIATFQTQSIIN